MAQALTAGSADTARYGYRFEGHNGERERADFEFVGTGGDLSLGYTGFDIDNTTEVAVFVNDVALAHLARTTNEARGPGTLVIPASVQASGTNILSFRQSTPGYMWGVTDLLLSEKQNLPPVADAGPDLESIFGQSLTLDGWASYDPDGDIASFSWTRADGTLIGTTSSVEYIPEAAGTETLTLTVTDDADPPASATDSLVLTILDTNRNVVIWPIGDSITRGKSFGFDLGQFPESDYRKDAGGPPGTLWSYREHLHDLLIDSSCGADVSWTGTRSFTDRIPSRHEGWSGFRIDRFLDSGWSDDNWSDSTGEFSGTRDLEGWTTTFDPDVVLVHLGSNDLGQGQTPISTAEELNVFIGRVLSAKPTVKIFVANLLPIVGWFGDHNYGTNEPLDVRGNAATLSSLIPNIVSEYQANGDDVYLVDVGFGAGYYVDENNAVSCPAATGGDPNNMTMKRCEELDGVSRPDGLHPALLGDRFIAEQFFAELQAQVGLCGVR